MEKMKNLISIVMIEIKYIHFMILMERIMYLVQEIFYIVNHQKMNIVKNVLKILQYLIIIIKSVQK